MFSHVKLILDQLENNQSIVARDEIFSVLREAGLDNFGDILMNMPNPNYPRVSSILPAMASVAVQEQWTGNHGRESLHKTCDFVRSLVLNYVLLGSKSLADTTILDFGCGYGRIARMMYFFVSEKQVYGVDAWEPSIYQCELARLGSNYLLSDYIPEKMPGIIRFDLAYAFSVFTHLSYRATLASFMALRESANKDAILCVTIRPPEYWDVPYPHRSAKEAMILKKKHIEEGFVFFPHPLNTLDNGGSTYGDTGISIEWMREQLAGWKVLSIDHSLLDPCQIYVYLLAV